MAYFNSGSKTITFHLLFTVLILALVSSQNITEENITSPSIPPTSTSTTLAPQPDLNISTTQPNSTNDETLLESFLSKPPDTPTNFTAPHFPPSCAHRSKSRNQPQRSATAKIRKCCPNGEVLNPEDDVPMCTPTNWKFDPAVLNVELYNSCIEDLEVPVLLDTEVHSPCANGSIFSKIYGDHLAVVQDGSLLIMDIFLNNSYIVVSDYCLDNNFTTGELYAIACYPDDHLSRSQTLLYTGFMIASVPCLFLVSFLHFAIKELRSVHGLSLGVMSSCMAIGFSLHTFAQFLEAGQSWIGFAVQFFMLAYFFWLFCLCCNVVAHVCYYLPNKTIINKHIRLCHFNTYCLIAFSFPFALVLWTNYQGLSGMPSYFYQGFTELARDSQRYFIPPVTIVLMLCLILLVISYFGYKHLDTINFKYATYQQVYSQTTLPIHIYDQESYQEIRKDTKCICCLYIITIITWVSEVVTFYNPGLSSFNIFMEILNASQGAFILLIFIVVRRRRNAILRWWHGRGPHGLTAVPMKDLNRSTITERN